MNDIYHYGVKGMKWGVRKSIQDRISKYKKRNDPYKGRIPPTKQLKKIKGSRLSNSQLEESIRRLDLENRYSEQVARYKRNHSPSFIKGLKTFSNVVKDTSSTTANVLKTYETGKQLGIRGADIYKKVKRK